MTLTEVHDARQLVSVRTRDNDKARGEKQGEIVTSMNVRTLVTEQTVQRSSDTPSTFPSVSPSRPPSYLS